MTQLLLDADIIAFKVASVSQKTFQFSPGDEPSLMVDDWEEVVPRIYAAIAAITDTLKSTDVVICLSCPTADNFRLNILPTYKGNRDYSTRPVHLAAVKDYMEATWPSYRRPHLEADDIMGILSTSGGGKKIIVSEDKDMQTIPGWLFNPSKDTAPHLITKVAADRFHLYQTICGDVTDGYTGCPGAGHEAATDILEGCRWEAFEHAFKKGIRKGTVETRWALVPDPDMPPWERLLTLYAKHGLTAADALVQARVARILRSTDYNFKTKEVILWEPRHHPGLSGKPATA